MSGSRSTNNLQAGLTLIEVLIVIAIASILAMFGTPIYQGYQLKTKVGSSVISAVPVRRLVTEYYILNNNWPADNADAGAGTPESYAANYVTRVAVSDTPQAGSIELTYDNVALRVLGNNNTLVFYPQPGANGNIVWKCDQGTIAMEYRPANCRS
jgi:type IV pilus assembly protein PilA